MRLLAWLGGVAAVALALPFAGPMLGLAGYRELAPEPGVRVNIPAGTLDVHQAGRGRDAVLVHGQPGWAGMMTPLAEALVPQGMRVTWYDRMGWGHSGQRLPDQMANPTAHAKDLLALIDVLGLHRPVIVGYSYGGGVAMEALRLDPGAADGLVLIGSVGAPGDRRGPQGAERFLFSPVFLRWAFGTSFTARAVIGPALEAVAAPETLSPRQRDLFLAALAPSGVAGHWEREQRERYEGFDDHQPAAVSACALVIHGAGDRVVSPDVGRAVAEAIPDAELVLLEGSGHAVVLTRAAALAERIAGHVERCEAAG